MELVTLKNGLRVAFEPRKEALSAAVQIFIGSGSGYESVGEEGTAHFIEHMVFKGSERYTSREIADITDMLGGNINAYTTKEYTCFHARTLPEHLSEMLDILTDMLTRPLLAPEALETERGVILEEIGMYEDSPEDLGFDLLSGAVWQGAPLAHPILGFRETVGAATPDSLRRFMEKNYTPERTVIAVCGKFDRNAVLEQIEAAFGDRKNTGAPLAPGQAVFHSDWVLHKKKTEQTHLYLAFPGAPSEDPDRHAISLFTEIAGGGSASRLNQRIREDLGLVYNCYAYHNPYLGCGAFGLWAALSPKNQIRFLEEGLGILDEMRSFSNETELTRAKEQFKANMIMSGESTTGTARSIGSQLLLRGAYTDPLTVAKDIEKVTADDIAAAAKRLFVPEKAALCVVGAPEKENTYRTVLERF